MNDLKQRVDDLREDADREGFYHFYITYTLDGDDAERSGFYEWDDDRGEYVNENGRTLTLEDAPDSAFEYNIEYE